MLYPGVEQRQEDGLLMIGPGKPYCFDKILNNANTFIMLRVKENEDAPDPHTAQDGGA